MLRFLSQIGAVYATPLLSTKQLFSPLFRCKRKPSFSGKVGFQKVANQDIKNISKSVGIRFNEWSSMLGKVLP